MHLNLNLYLTLMVRHILSEAQNHFMTPALLYLLLPSTPTRLYSPALQPALLCAECCPLLQKISHLNYRLWFFSTRVDGILVMVIKLLLEKSNIFSNTLVSVHGGPKNNQYRHREAKDIFYSSYIEIRNPCFLWDTLYGTNCLYLLIKI